MKQNKFPLGWDEDRVERVLAHYEEQSEEEAVAEDEAAFEAQDQTVMEVTTDLVPKIRDLIAKRKSARFISSGLFWTLGLVDGCLWAFQNGQVRIATDKVQQFLTPQKWLC